MIRPFETPAPGIVMVFRMSVSPSRTCTLAGKIRASKRSETVWFRRALQTGNMANRSKMLQTGLGAPFWHTLNRAAKWTFLDRAVLIACRKGCSQQLSAYTCEY